MGDQYTFIQLCPECGEPIECYYAGSSNQTQAKCDKCGKEYEIFLEFVLVEKKKIN